MKFTLTDMADGRLINYGTVDPQNEGGSVEELVERLLETHPHITSVACNMNTRRTIRFER